MHFYLRTLVNVFAGIVLCAVLFVFYSTRIIGNDVEYDDVKRINHLDSTNSAHRQHVQHQKQPAFGIQNHKLILPPNQRKQVDENNAAEEEDDDQEEVPSTSFVRSTPIIDVCLVFTHAGENARLRANLFRLLLSMLTRTRSQLEFHVITDEASEAIIRSVFNIVQVELKQQQRTASTDGDDNTTHDDLKVQVYDVNKIVAKLSDTIVELQHFSSRPGTYYSESFFFLSPGLHRVQVYDVNKIVAKLSDTIVELQQHFSSRQGTYYTILELQQHFSSKPGTYYSESLFFLSPGLHRVQVYDVNKIVAKLSDIIVELQQHFSSRPGTYYSESLFFLSPALHRVFENRRQFTVDVASLDPSARKIERLILIDVDIEFRADIRLLWDQFRHFSPTAVIGIGRELSPVYRHVMHAYRNKYPATMVGMPITATAADVAAENSDASVVQAVASAAVAKNSAAAADSYKAGASAISAADDARMKVTAAASGGQMAGRGPSDLVGGLSGDAASKTPHIAAINGGKMRKSPPLKVDAVKARSPNPVPHDGDSKHASFVSRDGVVVGPAADKMSGGAVSDADRTKSAANSDSARKETVADVGGGAAGDKLLSETVLDGTTLVQSAADATGNCSHCDKDGGADGGGGGGHSAGGGGGAGEDGGGEETRPSTGFPGLNSGVLLLDLQRMRRSHEYGALLTADRLRSLVARYKFHGHLGDQDLYTLLYIDHPHLFHMLPCSWNRQLCRWWQLHGYHQVFESYFECNETVKIYHGNCNTPIPQDEDFFVEPDS